MTTLLVDPDGFDQAQLRLEGSAFRHLVRARRLERGDELRVVDGAGSARRGRLAEVGRRHAVLELGESAPSNEPTLRIEIVVAPPRAGRASWMVEKLTELGVQAIHFVHTERAPRSFGSATLERFRRVATAAVEQSGRSCLPEITGVHPWSEVQALITAAASRWLLLPDAPRDLPPPADPTSLLIGPEGGWTKSERQQLASLASHPIGLGPTTLRVETAAIAAAALALAATPEDV